MKSKVQEFIDRHQLTVESTLVAKGNWRMTNEPDVFFCTIKWGAHQRATEYRKGVRHRANRLGKKAPYGHPKTTDDERALDGEGLSSFKPITPTAAELLECIAQDIQSISKHDDWLDWAEELGYNTADQLRKARDDWNQIVGHRKAFGVLSVDLIEALEADQEEGLI